MLRIKQTNPMHSVQDLGRYGFASQGVAKAGPMDSVAACWANSCLGNAVTLPLLEIGGGGFVAEFTKDVNLALAGAWGEMTLDGQPLPGPGAHPVLAGSILRLGRFSSGMFSYLAVQGGFAIQPVLGSVSTCQRDSLGGLDGQGEPLSIEDTLPYQTAERRPVNLIPRRYLESYHQPLVCDVILRETDQLASDATDLFFNQGYKVTREQSRMGYRLDGDLSIVAERPRYSVPIPLGGIQVPPSGQPIVLMRDHQSLGGYPMLGTLTRKSLGQLAQRRAGQMVSFRAVSREIAVQEFLQYRQFFGDFR
ncbi:biotin-dependent carboxyltransferase family protein [Litorivicinus sp.]|nr:biotin-dependent carboxyltransferase family protein [Litorivicinaceae bacterium]MDC0882680.1 biotin-dependent carboxyltransferase family protein [Litorivicinus sp.]MDC1087674.1 biotin-dependent carboxyltransferase family protein [Litorivicinus sp.]